MIKNAKTVDTVTHTYTHTYNLNNIKRKNKRIKDSNKSLVLIDDTW